MRIALVRPIRVRIVIVSLAQFTAGGRMPRLAGAASRGLIVLHEPLHSEVVEVTEIEEHEA